MLSVPRILSNPLPAKGELLATLRKFKRSIIVVGVLSAVLNVLALTGSIYLLLVYDRVLLSGSIPSLISIFAIVILLYVFQGIFDNLRSNLLRMIGEGFDRLLVGRLQQIESGLALSGGLGALPSTPVRDLDQIRGFLSGPGPSAIIDLPWILFFLAILFLVHPLLGVTVLAGTIVLAVVAVLNDRGTRAELTEVTTLQRRLGNASDRVRRSAASIKGLGITDRMNAAVLDAHAEQSGAQSKLSRVITKFSVLGRGMRMFVQSSVLTVGALLVIDGEASGGIIFASSILSGRALAPVDQAIANWRGFVSAREAWTRLETLLREHPAQTQKSVSLGQPGDRLQVEQLAAAPPAAPTRIIAEANFVLSRGSALAIVGPSGSGKSSLVRTIANVWRPAEGEVRLDGAPLGQYSEAELRQAIGYLPQEVELFAGTIAQNISRFDPAPPSEAVTAAAKAAAIHDLILRLSDGYDSAIGEGGAVLSAGQRQRVALARALYGSPFLLALDEPDSSLDGEGEAALAAAIANVRKRGGIVVVVTHRATLLREVDLMMVMRDGKQQAFGPRDEVLELLSSNRPASSGGNRQAAAARPERQPS